MPTKLSLATYRAQRAAREGGYRAAWQPGRAGHAVSPGYRTHDGATQSAHDTQRTSRPQRGPVPTTGDPRPN